MYFLVIDSSFGHAVFIDNQHSYHKIHAVTFAYSTLYPVYLGPTFVISIDFSHNTAIFIALCYLNSGNKPTAAFCRRNCAWSKCSLSVSSALW
jgi:hypothetical protein